MLLRFSKARLGQAAPTKGNTRITIYIDDQIVAAFKAERSRPKAGIVEHGVTARKGRPVSYDRQRRRVVREHSTLKRSLN